MSEVQLREAFALMKQGNKAEAAKLVQAVLREDRDNVYAWWLFANVLEDEEKIVKSLERVLALNPEHPGARKRLAELRPEYAHLSQPKLEEKVKNPDPQAGYWDRVDARQVPKAKPLNPNQRLSLWIFALGSVFAFLVLAFFVNVAGSFVAASEAETEEDNSILAEMANNPESVTQAYFEAFFREDVEALHTIVCSADKAWLEESIADFDTLRPDTVSVDFSETSFLMEYSSTKEATISINGRTVIYEGGVSYTINWAELAVHEETDYFGIDLQLIDETWLICDY